MLDTFKDLALEKSIMLGRVEGKKKRMTRNKMDGFDYRGNGHTIEQCEGPDNSGTKSIYLNQNLSWLRTDSNLMAHNNQTYFHI